MHYRMSAMDMMKSLNREKIQTWFDLTLYLDRVKEEKPVPVSPYEGNFRQFKDDLRKGSMAFMSFHFSVDGVTVEAEKYAKIFGKLFRGLNIHYIAGEFLADAEKLTGEDARRYVMPEIRGFDDWDLYHDFYKTRLERGSEAYNVLIIKFWQQVKRICSKLGAYLQEHKISLLYLINVCSNPGNVSFALATVLISEYMGIPVMNNNHDFYWEGGNRAMDIELGRAKKGPRDFFFTNAGIGEFFSIIEMIYPWESRSWLNININQAQTEHLIIRNGHNPANVAEIGTAVDTEEYLHIPKRKKINAYLQFEQILSRYRQALISYSVKDVIQNKLVSEKNPRPILIGTKTKPIHHFSSENIVLLQPTRIIARKRIEVGFRLIRQMLQNQVFKEQLGKHPDLKLTLVITGPIAIGQYAYFEKLIRRFDKFMDVLKPPLRERVYMACLFSELDKDSFKQRFEHPVGIPELYNIASLILLPSKTEGRGLPIIEATACGTPIICRRYMPKNVYREVIGEHLDEKDRLKVIEFDGKNIKSRHIRDITDRIFFPNKYVTEVLHNRRAVLKRYSLEALEKNILNLCRQLHMQLQPNESSMSHTRKALTDFQKINALDNADLQSLLNTTNREYLPGYGKLSFMIMLKSLIDPSYFRVEQQFFRGIALNFARQIITRDPDHGDIPVRKTSAFYNAVDNIFLLREGETTIRHDHSMSYRHRNKYHYPYQDYTIQEITGIINLLYVRLLKPKIRQRVDETPHFFTDWNLALAQLTTSNKLAIDDREQLMDKMHQNLPIAYFPGDYLTYELEFFALQSIRSRLKLSIEEELTDEKLEKSNIRIAPIYIFAQDQSLVRQWNRTEIIEYLSKGQNEELTRLWSGRIIRVVSTGQLSVGIHFRQMGEKAIRVLKRVKDQQGYIISNRRNASVMTDIVDIDRFHIGKVRSEITANMLGIPMESGYIQYVPAGLRPTLAYPTPVQTAYELSKALKSDLYRKMVRKLGEQEVLTRLRKDAEVSGSPVMHVLEQMKGGRQKKGRVEYRYVSGRYEDGNPWSGVMAKTGHMESARTWKFIIVNTKDKPRKVTAFCSQAEEKHGIRASIAWNGGYILNPELVGKLGLPETYIGSPLGLIISHGKIHSVPLFNKAALLIEPGGRIGIRRINIAGGFEIRLGRQRIVFEGRGYQNPDPDIDFAYYDLMYERDEIPAGGRVIVRLAGNRVKEVIREPAGGKVPVIPVGLTLSIRREVFPEQLGRLEKALNLNIYGLEGVEHAVEAGPLLLKDGKACIRMEEEGWNTRNSIRTQAARLDYTDMRGPKIAAGTDDRGNLSVLTVNGRIRESVGATHQDMAEIMQGFGIRQAMGFDPGGSSTLVVEGQTLNISPYNHAYEENVFSLPPEPRAVSNAVIGYIES